MSICLLKLFQTGNPVPFEGFCLSTGVHGYAYIANSRNRFDFIFWVFISAFALLGATYICNDAVQHWRENPLATRKGEI